MITTSAEVDVSEEMMRNYFSHLVNSFFKILPIREGGGKSLPVYLRSLQVEILGCKKLILELDYDPRFITLSSILEYLIDNPECEVKVVKREVFRAIDICNKLKTQYTEAV